MNLRERQVAHPDFINSLTKFLAILQSMDGKSVYIWPPGSKQPVMIAKDSKGVSVSSDGVIDVSPSAITSAVIRAEGTRKPSFVLAYPFLSGVKATSGKHFEGFQQRMTVIAAIGLFGASSACAAYFQVLVNDNPTYAGIEKDLWKAFIYFIYGTTAAFFCQVDIASSSHLAIALYFCRFLGCAVIMAIGITHLALAMHMPTPSIAMMFVFMLAPPCLSAIQGLNQVLRTFSARRGGRGSRSPTAIGADSEHDAASAFIHAYDLYGGVLEYIHSDFPELALSTIEEQARDYVTVIERR
ncbi:hypothetical protein AURDEDRAFT_160932 [Auricularia subglabra TFB-10046 SS5]|nr:hypothetical protein AURDEDRAFT_160932 [Auricularia subglabra TFB-10046 SS5]